jgi:hypothetical protein
MGLSVVGSARILIVYQKSEKGPFANEPKASGTIHFPAGNPDFSVSVVVEILPGKELFSAKPER